MNARFLMILFDTSFLLAMTAWLGSILFFSFGVAPIIFNVLGVESGGKFVRALFPRYYAWGAVSGAVALPSTVAVPLCYPEMRGLWVALQSLLIIAGILLMFYAGNTLTPAINAARDEGPAGEARFDRLHRRSVRLNAVTLLLGVGVLLVFVTRPIPTTSGIVEPTPVERARIEAQRILGPEKARTPAAPAR
ncbi:MAG: DUF4149 domain-containing protein [Isosphaeraceae bacterium]